MKPDQRSVTIGTQSLAAMYLQGVKDRLTKAERLRAMGAFTLYDKAVVATGLSSAQLRQQLEREKVKSVLALDPERNRETRFYFPPGIEPPADDAQPDPQSARRHK